MGNDARVAFLLDDFPLNGWVVDQPELRISLRSYLVKEMITEIHGHGETFEDIEAEGEALLVEVIHHGFEAWETRIGRARSVHEAAMLVAFLVVDAAVCFGPISGVALVYFRVGKLPCEFCLEWERKE